MSKLDVGVFRPSSDVDPTDMRERVDWSATPLGPAETWPAALGTASALVLAARYPMMLFWGPQFVCLMNAAARALSGTGTLAVGPAEQLWPEGWARLRTDVGAVFDGGPAISHDDRALPVVVQERSVERHFSLTCSPILDPGGVGGVIVVLVERPVAGDEHRFRNIASVAQAAVVASEERLRRGLEAGRMVTWEFDLQTGQLNQSSNSEAIFGPGTSSSDYTARMPPEDVALDRAQLQRALASPDGLYTSEFRYHHPDGRVMFLQNWGQVMRDATGAPARVHGVCMDISDRKQAETALVQLAAMLEQQVERRTEELQQAEEALRQAQKMEALGHLTGGVAHDFNNLLGAMIGSFELIRRKYDDAARVRDLAGAGLSTAERGAKLISQLLTFSRAQRVELTAVQVDAVIDGMREMLRRTLGPLITLRFDVDCQERFVLSDATQLEMALLNLAINARDAMVDGGQLTIAAGLRSIERGAMLSNERGAMLSNERGAMLSNERDAMQSNGRDAMLSPGEYVELRVQDTGIGMSPEVATRAFDPFFTTKGVGKGTGLGLSQVHSLARQAGGAVRIESRPGDGTTIRMLLPCTDAPVGIERLAQTPLHPGKTTRATVLLVDDDHDLRAVLAASLRDFGYTVIEAVDGVEGLAIVEQHAPDLLVADFAMPRMTGADLARAARRLKPTLPIIFASGYAAPPDLAPEAGPAPRVLRKPFRLSELQAAIEQALC